MAVSRNNKIGTNTESSLHRALKFSYAEGGKTEEVVDGFIADGINTDGEYIEVQTGSFAPLKKKTASFAALGKVIIIHPIVINKYIENYSEDGELLYRRKSPKKGCEWDLFDKLMHAPELPLTANISVELAIVDVVEKRVSDGKGSWRRKGVSIKDRELSAWHSRLRLDCPADYRCFIPFKKGKEFTALMLAEKAGISQGLARKTVYVLNKMGVVSRTGKRDRSWLYILPAV